MLPIWARGRGHPTEQWKHLNGHTLKKGMIFPHLATLPCQYLWGSRDHFFHLCPDIGWFDFVRLYADNYSFCDFLVVIAKAQPEDCFTVPFPIFLSHPSFRHVLDVLWCSLSLGAGGCLVNKDGKPRVEPSLSISLYFEYLCISAVTVGCLLQKEAPLTETVSSQGVWIQT